MAAVANLTQRVKKISPVWVAWVFGLLILGLYARSVLVLAIDQPISTSAIQAQKIRVKTTQLSAFQARVAAYEKPANPATIRSDVFGPAPAGTEGLTE